MNAELSPLPRGGGGQTLVMAYTGIQGGSAQMGYVFQASGTDCV